MARPLRIEYPGAYYHVTSRGNEQKPIFRDNQDRGKFLDLLGRAAEQFHLRVHAYVLMGNHYHLLVETPRGELNRALRYLNGVYTQSFNRRHGRVGHLFQGRYKAILVDRESYLLELSRYIHLNPWRLRRSENPFAYRWSSLRAYGGKAAIPPWLTVKEVLSYFGSKGKKGYRGFVLEGIKEGVKTPWEEVRGQAVIGSEGFVDEMVERYLKGMRDRKELSGIREIVGARPEDVLREVGKHFGIEGGEISGRGQRYTEPRYLASYLLRRYCLMSLREIGERVGLHYSAVGNAIRRVRESPTRTMARALRELEANFKNQ
ncbi:MAG: transposase [Deltaproteobacteria bacterium]|nr:transposase [Deltaproteobacteria bacterium]